MDSGMFVRRPKAEETEDDLLAMQEQWENSQKKEKPAVTVHRPKKKNQPEQTTKIEEIPANSAPKHQKVVEDFRGARFELDLEEDSPCQVMCSVEEKNVEWLKGDRSEELVRKGFDQLAYSKEGGFPLALDLSSYYRPGEDGQMRTAPVGKSFFAAEFDRLHGSIDEATCSYKDVSDEPVDTADFGAENDKYLAKLGSDKIEEMKQELLGRLDPKMLEFLATRHKKAEKQPADKKVSKFKQAKLDAAAAKETKPLSEASGAPPGPVQAPNPPNPQVEDLVKELEVLDEYANREDDEKYNRLATDAVQMDFTTKSLRMVLPRQLQNAVRLFDNLKHVPTGETDGLREMARSRLEDIKQLYLEEIEVEGRRVQQFAAGLNPLVDGSWTLRPVRSVLDAAQKRGNVNLTEDDLDIVRLSLLWTLLLFTERPSAFYAFAEPNDFYVRLSEVYLLGTEALSDDVVMEATSRLMDNYILKSAVNGRLCLRLQNKIAGLDAFMPFYEDLLRQYESYSLGDVQFARALLIGAYMNSGVGDSLECRFAIWSPRLNTARQMTVGLAAAADLLDRIRSRSEELATTWEEQHYTQYVSLLGAYAAAIRDEKVTRDRNPLLFTIAAEELGRFVQRHTKEPPSVGDQKAKEFDGLVEIVRSTVKGKLAI